MTVSLFSFKLEYPSPVCCADLDTACSIMGHDSLSQWVSRCSLEQSSGMLCSLLLASANHAKMVSCDSELPQSHVAPTYIIKFESSLLLLTSPSFRSLSLTLMAKGCFWGIEKLAEQKAIFLYSRQRKCQDWQYMIWSFLVQEVGRQSVSPDAVIAPDQISNMLTFWALSSFLLYTSIIVSGTRRLLMFCWHTMSLTQYKDRCGPALRSGAKFWVLNCADRAQQPFLMYWDPYTQPLSFWAFWMLSSSSLLFRTSGLSCTVSEAQECKLIINLALLVSSWDKISWTWLSYPWLFEIPKVGLATLYFRAKLVSCLGYQSYAHQSNCLSFVS